MMCWMCIFTVFSERFSFAAISLLGRPSSNAASTCCSRGVKSIMAFLHRIFREVSRRDHRRRLGLFVAWRSVVSDDWKRSADPAGENKTQAGDSEFNRDRRREEAADSRCIAASALASSSRFDNSAIEAFGWKSSSSARSSSTEGSTMDLSPMLSATKRTSRFDTQPRLSVVAISTISNPGSSRLRMLRIQVRVRVRGSIITRTGKCSDPLSRSTESVRSSIRSPSLKERPRPFCIPSDRNLRREIRSRAHHHLRSSMIFRGPASALPDHALLADIPIRDRGR